MVCVFVNIYLISYRPDSAVFLVPFWSCIWRFLHIHYWKDKYIHINVSVYVTDKKHSSTSFFQYCGQHPFDFFVFVVYFLWFKHQTQANNQHRTSVFLLSCLMGQKLKPCKGGFADCSKNWWQKWILKSCIWKVDTADTSAGVNRAHSGKIPPCFFFCGTWVVVGH